MYSDDKIPKLYCLFICWQHRGNTISSEEQPAPAEVGARAGGSWSARPLSATDVLCGPDKLQMFLTLNSLSLSSSHGQQWLLSLH